MKFSLKSYLALGSLLFVASQTVSAQPASKEAKGALSEIQKTFGFVPGFFRAFPEEGVAGAWEEFKSVQLNPKSALPNKYKELIGLGLAAQIPCEYCTYFHTKAARANGATELEIKEAVAISSIVRHWSTYLNGSQTDEAAFKRELDQAIQNIQAGAGKPPPVAINIADAQSAREDIQATFGLVPTFLKTFPDSGIAGAWKEMKTVQLNPKSAIPGKYKELIGLAVAAQIPCRYCVTFHTSVSSKLHGATEAEIQETLALAGIVRHWSTFLNGMQIDKATFRREVDRVMSGSKKTDGRRAQK
jgi:AhpD family alkylhydroperoxidase